MIGGVLRGIDGSLKPPCRIGFIRGKDEDRGGEPYLLCVLVHKPEVVGMIVWQGGQWAPAGRAKLGTARELASAVGAEHYLEVDDGVDA
jgi:hypothetical protein